ncbi:MAG: hydrogenase small subunit [Candidatus Geothermincolia bacterium]
MSDTSDIDIEKQHLEHAKKIAGHLDLPDHLIDDVHEHMDELAGGIAPVIWIQGQNCTGCTIALMDSDRITPGNLVTGRFSLRYQPDLMAAEGSQAIDIIERTEREFAGKYIVVLEGAVPTGEGEEFCTFGLSQTTMQLMGNTVPAHRTVFDWLVELIPGAEAVMAIGNCASFGGIPTMGSQVTGATSATDVVEAIDSTKPVINVSGCPPHPDWITGTLLDLLLWVDDHKDAPVLDEHMRLKKFYECKVHDTCERRSAFEAKHFVEDWNETGPDEERCLLKMGCRGPVTHGDCTMRKWNSSVSWCVGMNTPCQGCTEPGFHDRLPHLK